MKTSSSDGMRGEKSCTRDRKRSLPRLESSRASAGRDVSGVCRRWRLRRDWLVPRVANAERPLELMPEMCERVSVSRLGRERRLLSLKALAGRQLRCKCLRDGRQVSVRWRSVSGASDAPGRQWMERLVRRLQERWWPRKTISWDASKSAGSLADMPQADSGRNGSCCAGEGSIRQFIVLSLRRVERAWKRRPKSWS